MVLTITDQIGIVLKVASVCWGLYFLFEENWICVLILIPIFFIDMYMGHNKNTNAMSKILMFFLLFQSILAWYFFSSNIWSMPPSAPMDNTMVLNHFYGGASRYVDTMAEPDQGMATMADVVKRKKLQDSGKKAAPDRETPTASMGSQNAHNAKNSNDPAATIITGYHHTEHRQVTTTDDNGLIWSPILSEMDTEHISEVSQNLIVKVVGRLPAIDFPDLQYRSPAEIRTALPRVFDELPADGFDEKYRNPCWMAEGTEEFVQQQQGGRGGPGGGRGGRGGPPQGRGGSSNSRTLSSGGPALACLPYAYILGMPKCGTSDIFERMKGHDRIK